MAYVQLTADDLGRLRAIVARKQPSLLNVIERINTGEITEDEQAHLIDTLDDELWEHGIDSNGTTTAGEPVRYLIDAVQVVPYLVRDCDFASVVLLAPIPANAITASALAPDEGLVPGDEGTIVDAYHAPKVYTVEFFRDGESVGVADITPAQVRVVAPSFAPVAVPTAND